MLNRVSRLSTMLPASQMRASRSTPLRSVPSTRASSRKALWPSKEATRPGKHLLCPWSLMGFFKPKMPLKRRRKGNCNPMSPGFTRLKKCWQVVPIVMMMKWCTTQVQHQSVNLSSNRGAIFHGIRPLTSLSLISTRACLNTISQTSRGTRLRRQAISTCDWSRGTSRGWVTLRRG